MVLVISGMMVSFGLQARQSSSPECYTVTRQQMATIRSSIEAFARKNDRLPLPAARNIGIEDINYGRESSGANIDTASGVSFGAVPFQSLGLSPTYAGDCWGNKFSYAVTTALTTNSSTSGYMNYTILGNITLESSLTTPINTTTAYAIISHGEDGLGAVKLNYSAANAGGTPDTAHHWCSSPMVTLKYVNCVATSATLADGVFNDGANAGVNYFDDIIVASGRPQMTNTSNLYCWGTDLAGYGTLGDGAPSSTHNILVPARVHSNVQFTTLLDPASYGHAQTPCALTSDGSAYCWGLNLYGSVGDGTTGNTRSVPTAVNTSVKFSKIYSFVAGTTTPTTFALATDGTPYFWGGLAGWAGNLFIGVNGGAASTYYSSPTAVSTTQKFTKLVNQGTETCGLNAVGEVWCWGNQYQSSGVGYYTTDVTVKIVAGGHKFSDIVGPGPICGLTSAADASGMGNLFCWGSGGITGIGLPPLSITGITNATPGVVSYTGGYSLVNGDTGYIRNVTGMGEVDYISYYPGTASSYTTSSFQLNNSPWLGTGNISSSTYHTYAGGGQIILTGTATPRQILAGTPIAKLISSTSVIGTDGKLYQWGGNDIAYLGTGSGSANHQGRTTGYAITNITQANPAVVTTSLAHGLSTGDFVYIYSAPGMTGTPNISPTVWRVGAVPTTTTFQLTTLSGDNLDTTSYTALTSNGIGDKVPTDNSDFMFNGSFISYASNTPIPVPGFSHVTAATNQGWSQDTYTMVDSGTLYGWGPGSSWNVPVGDNTTSGRSTPVPLTVTGIPLSTSYFYGPNSAMLLDTAGNAYEWGENIYGEAGQGNTTAVLKPTLVGGGHTWSSMMNPGSQNYFSGVWCGLSPN